MFFLKIFLKLVKCQKEKWKPPRFYEAGFLLASKAAMKLPGQNSIKSTRAQHDQLTKKTVPTMTVI